MNDNAYTQVKPRRGLVRFVAPLAMITGGWLIMVFFALLFPVNLFGIFLILRGLAKTIKVF